MNIYKFVYISILLPVLLITAQDSNLSNMYRLAKTFEQSGEFDQAKSIYEDIYKVQPTNTLFLDALNNIYILLKEYDKSIQLMTENIKASPENVNFYGILGNTYFTKGDTTKAFEIWEEGLEISRNNTAIYRAIINYALQNRAFNKAIEYLNQAKKLGKDANVFSLDLARVYSMTMNFEKAAIEYCNIIESDPTMVQVVIGNMTSFLTRPNALLETINAVKYFNERKDIPEIHSVLIHLYKLNDDYNNAFEYVKKLESETKNNGREYFQFAQQALVEKKFRIAARSFGKVVEDYPNSPLIPLSRIGYANTFEQSLNNKRDSLSPKWKPYSPNELSFQSEFKNAIDSYKKIIELYPNNDIRNEALFRIAGIYIDKLDEPDSALLYYDKVINSSRVAQFQLDSRLRIAEIEMLQGEIQPAQERLNSIIKNSANPDQFKSKAGLLLGKIYFWSGQFKKASAALSTVTENLFDDNANDALQILTLIGALKSDSLNLALYAEAEFSAFRNNFAEAAAQFDKLRNANNPILSELAGLKYAYVLVGENKYNLALEILKETKEKSSLSMFDPEIDYITGEIKLFAIKDYEGAQAAYRNILENYSNSLYFDRSREKIEIINGLKNKSI